MGFKEQLFIIRNWLFEKKNIVLVSVLIIIFLILITCLTIIQLSIDNKREILNSVDERTYKIVHKVIEDDVNHKIVDIEFTEEQIELLKNVKHVESVVNEKYQTGSRIKVPSFDKGSEEGILYLKALLNYDDIKVKNGNALENKYELVCSNIFYPHEFDNQIYSNLFVSNGKFIGKTIKVISSNEDLNEKEITLKIVGSYENKYMETANTCYTDVETYDEISSKYDGWFESYDENGNLIEIEYIENYDYFVVIDSKDNVSFVLEELKNLNFEFYPYSYTDFTFLNSLFIIPLFVSVAVIVLTFFILYNFISKKNINRLNNVGILKAIGYDEKDIISLIFKENVILVIISFIISLFIYFVVLNYLTYTLLAEITYNSAVLDVPYILIIILLVLFIYIVYLIIKLNFKKIFSYSNQELLAIK